jgi:hypothetical protein
MLKRLANRVCWPVFLVIVLAFISACASSAEIDLKAKTFQRVGVISVAGAYLTQMKVGLTAFGNERLEADVSDLQLDRKYELIVAEALRSKAGLDAVPVSTIPESLRSMFQPSTLRHVAFYLDSRWFDAEEVFKVIAKSNNVDALVLLAPMTSGDYFGRTNQLLRGFGIYASSRPAKLHLISRLVVISGQTGKPIGHAPVSSVQPTFPGGPHQRGQPSIDVDDSLAGTPFASMTQEQKTQLQNIGLAIPLAAAIDATIP